MSEDSGRFDETLRRATPADPAATLRREEMDATLRRDDPDKTLRRSASEQNDAYGGPEGDQVFPCELDGRRLSLTVERALGIGGEGELYLCRSGSESYVAKILRHDSDTEVLSAMVRQHGELEKNHLVPCLHVGNMREVAGSSLDRRTYVVHPYYEGGDLSVLRNARRINPSITYSGDEQEFRPRAECYVDVHCDYSSVDEEAFQELVGQLAQALCALHGMSFARGTRGAVHRDIKPQNVFMDTTGRFALGDFGLISAMSSGSPMKFTQRIGLSHGYSPPEAYSDRAFKQTVTRKYDYFSLGMTLLHIAGGRPRYIIDDDLAQIAPSAMTLADFYETIMLSAVSVPEEMPRRIRSLIRGLLAADPDDRWGEREVSAWLEGRNPLVPAAKGESAQGISLRIQGRTEQGARAVAAAMVQNWDMCAQLAADGELTFSWDDPDTVYRDEVNRAADMAAFAEPDIALQTLVLTVYRKMGHVFRGQRFETDEALGEAMLHAAAQPDSDQYALFRDYLVMGALSNTWNLAGSTRGDAVRRTLLRLERSADREPAAAIYAAGSMLCGRPVPPVSVRLGSEDVTFASADEIGQWVCDELASCAARSEEPLLSEEPPRIPGCWITGGRAVLRQIDSSILLDDARILEPVAVSGGLLALARILFLPGSLPEERDTRARLLAMLCTGGCTADVSSAQVEEASGPDGFVPWLLVQLLAMFPQARTQHAWDDLLLGMLRGITDRLMYISGVRTPGASLEQRIDAEIDAVRCAAEKYIRTNRFEDFADAVQQVNRSRAVLAELRSLNYANAQRILTMMPAILSTGNPEVREAFDKLCGRWASTPGGRQDLIELSQNLDAMDETIAEQKKSDLSPYLLSDTMLFIRNYNQSAQQPLDIVLPDTTDAAEYYSALRRQVHQKRSKLVLTGLVDEDGNVLR